VGVELEGWNGVGDNRSPGAFSGAAVVIGVACALDGENIPCWARNTNRITATRTIRMKMMGMATTKVFFISFSGIPWVGIQLSVRSGVRPPPDSPDFLEMGGEDE
jgi:hypothetical protein